MLDYRLDVDGTARDDPYRYPPTLGELDLHLIGEGRHEQLWTVLGAHAAARRAACAFAVWAPNARGVRVVGDFTGWGAARRLADALAGRQRRVGAVRARTPRPGTATSTGSSARDGVWRDKADPMAAHAEVPAGAPHRWSTDSTYEWSDGDWMAAAGRAAAAPASR